MSLLARETDFSPQMRAGGGFVFCHAAEATPSLTPNVSGGVCFPSSSPAAPHPRPCAPPPPPHPLRRRACPSYHLRPAPLLCRHPGPCVNVPIPCISCHHTPAFRQSRYALRWRPYVCALRLRSWPLHQCRRPRQHLPLCAASAPPLPAPPHRPLCLCLHSPISPPSPRTRAEGFVLCPF